MHVFRFSADGLVLAYRVRHLITLCWNSITLKWFRADCVWCEIGPKIPKTLPPPVSRSNQPCSRWTTDAGLFAIDTRLEEFWAIKGSRQDLFGMIR